MSATKIYFRNKSKSPIVFELMNSHIENNSKINEGYWVCLTKKPWYEIASFLLSMKIEVCVKLVTKTPAIVTYDFVLIDEYADGS